MNHKDRQEIGLIRYSSVLAVQEYLRQNNNKTKRDAYSFAASKSYKDKFGKEIKMSAYTVSRWVNLFEQFGFDSLIPKERNDAGKFRKLDTDMMERIRYYKEKYPRLPATAIYGKLIEDGTIQKKDVSLSSVNRYVNKLKNETGTPHDRHRYEREHINEVWCGDSSYGPFITQEDGSKKRVYIIALIDDASRMIVGIDVFYNDNYLNLLTVIESAIRKYGRPALFNFDNGKSYRNHQMALMSARIESSVNYCAPYTPQSKSKIERFFRTLKDHWMAALTKEDLKDLDSLRNSLMKYIDRYNNAAHTSLNGNNPYDRFFSESDRIKRLTDRQLEYAFLLEDDRKVSQDNVIVIDKHEYEVDYHYNNQKIKIRYKPDLSEIYVVNEKTGELTELKLLDKHSNSIVKREKLRLSGGENT